MFSLKNKIDLNLKNALENKIYKSYRVIIHCKSIQSKIEKKLEKYKCEIINSIPSIGCICCNLSSNTIERLIEYPEIDYISFDNYALLCGNSAVTENGFSFKNNLKLTGKDICIGIVDSGVYPHADLKKPTNRIENFLDLVNNLNYPYDDNGHGTFISGVISASGYCSKGMNKGIAEKSKIYMIKAFNKIGRGFVSDILFSIQTLINESKEHNIKVICLPFEIIDYNSFILSLFSKLFDIAVEKNMIIIVPSGHNTNIESSMRGISILNNCITVGGIDTSHGKKPYFASSGGLSSKSGKPDLCAPCVNFCSLNSNLNYISEKNGQKLYPHPMNELYTFYTGTSCATAYVSGLCALLFEKNPDLTYKDIVSLLKMSCSILDMPKSIQGVGIINFNKLFT